MKLYLRYLAIASIPALSLMAAPPSLAADEAPRNEKAQEAKDKSKTESSAQTPHSFPAAAREHYNKGVELHRAGSLNKAILEYKEAIVNDAMMEPAYSNLGLIYTAQKSWHKALEAFDKALSQKPDRTTSLNGLGTVLYAMKRNEEAMEKWRKAVEIDPKFASAYYNMGNAYENQEKHREALESYVKAADVNPNMADAYYRLGLLMIKTKHSAQASVLLDKAIKLSPEADFARDARKQIENLQKVFEKEGSELKTTITTESDTKAQQETSKPREVAQTGNSPSDKKKDPKQLIKSIFKKPGADKPVKNVNMFVQPSPDSDLKAKPQ